MKYYLRGNIVSESNKTLWANVLRTVTTMPEHAADDKDDPDEHLVEALPEDAFPVLSPAGIMAALCCVDQDGGPDLAREGVGHRSQTVQTAMEQSISFWNPTVHEPLLHEPRREPAIRCSTDHPQDG